MRLTEQKALTPEVGRFKADALNLREWQEKKKQTIEAEKIALEAGNSESQSCRSRGRRDPEDKE